VDRGPREGGILDGEADTTFTPAGVVEHTRVTDETESSSKDHEPVNLVEIAKSRTQKGYLIEGRALAKQTSNYGTGMRTKVAGPVEVISIKHRTPAVPG
jgi:hypothetical protein